MRELNDNEVGVARNAGMYAAIQKGLDRDTAEDVGQVTAMACWMSLRVNNAGETVLMKTNKSVPLEAYARGIGQHKAKDVLCRRSRQAVPHEYLPEQENEIGAEGLAEWCADLTQGVARLDAELTAIYQLLYVTGCSPQQAATHLRIETRKVNHLHSQLRRTVGRNISRRLKQPRGAVIDRVVVGLLNRGRSPREVASMLAQIGNGELVYGEVLPNLSRADFQELTDAVRVMRREPGADLTRIIEFKISRLMLGEANDRRI
jgi:DNA-directed RNA polymerase specialized sigma24 family protein